jgi:hypothetical protein
MWSTICGIALKSRNLNQYFTENPANSGNFKNFFDVKNENYCGFGLNASHTGHPWGGRGRRFKSCRSDQEPRILCGSGLFAIWGAGLGSGLKKLAISVAKNRL